MKLDQFSESSQQGAHRAELRFMIISTDTFVITNKGCIWFADLCKRRRDSWSRVGCGCGLPGQCCTKVTPGREKIEGRGVLRCWDFGSRGGSWVVGCASSRNCVVEPAGRNMLHHGHVRLTAHAAAVGIGGPIQDMVTLRLHAFAVVGLHGGKGGSGVAPEVILLAGEGGKVRPTGCQCSCVRWRITPEEVAATLRDHRGLKLMHFIHEPLDDLEVPGNQRLHDFTNQLEERVTSGEKLLLHCMGGRGRSNLVAGCLLAQMYGLPAEEAAAVLQFAYDSRDYDNCVVPETQRQRATLQAFCATQTVAACRSLGLLFQTFGLQRSRVLLSHSFVLWIQTCDLNLVNGLLQVNLTKVEQCASGAIYCQIIDSCQPGSVAMRKGCFAKGDMCARGKGAPGVAGRQDALLPIHEEYRGKKCPPEVVESVRQANGDRAAINKTFDEWMNCSEDWAQTSWVVNQRSTTSKSRTQTWAWLCRQVAMEEIGPLAGQTRSFYFPRKLWVGWRIRLVRQRQAACRLKRHLWPRRHDPEEEPIFGDKEDMVLSFRDEEIRISVKKLNHYAKLMKSKQLQDAYDWVDSLARMKSEPILKLIQKAIDDCKDRRGWDLARTYITEACPGRGKPVKSLRKHSRGVYGIMKAPRNNFLLRVRQVPLEGECLVEGLRGL
ncbi:Microtubule-associated protein RP/EB family member 1C [Symbiodinium microadriaticum]|uniref:Microtubule-associated protein RP/EB family member 1C n=1 Tax=Symbiodinium microadriaticum TaxID=2951 RepID=A0A1Q9E5V8_SYMMI|nr:Microtubule-associated protein RP/EB family member 1C [Symbiodinium microadriaticum]